MASFTSLAVFEDAVSLDPLSLTDLLTSLYAATVLHMCLMTEMSC